MFSLPKLSKINKTTFFLFEFLYEKDWIGSKIRSASLLSKKCTSLRFSFLLKVFITVKGVLRTKAEVPIGPYLDASTILSGLRSIPRPAVNNKLKINKRVADDVKVEELFTFRNSIFLSKNQKRSKVIIIKSGICQ